MTLLVVVGMTVVTVGVGCRKVSIVLAAFFRSMPLRCIAGLAHAANPYPEDVIIHPRYFCVGHAGGIADQIVWKGVFIRTAAVAAVAAVAAAVAAVQRGEDFGGRCDNTADSNINTANTGCPTVVAAAAAAAAAGGDLLLLLLLLLLLAAAMVWRECLAPSCTVVGFKRILGLGSVPRERRANRRSLAR